MSGSNILNQFNIPSANVAVPPPPAPEQEKEEESLFSKFMGMAKKNIALQPPSPLPGGEALDVQRMPSEENIQKRAEELRANYENYVARVEQLAVDNQGTLDPKISKNIGVFGEKFNFEPTETSNLINEKAGVKIQRDLAFVDDEDDYINVLNKYLGEGNFRVFEDKDKKGFDPKYYVSVKRDDGTFTDYSPATRTLAETFTKIATQAGYETAASAANLAQASTLGYAVSGIPVIGIPLGITLFTYQLYTGGKGIERGREFIKNELEINDAEQIESIYQFFENTKNQVIDLQNPLNIGAGGFAEELSGVLEVVGGIAGVKSLLKVAFSNIREKYVLKNVKIEGRDKGFDTLVKTQDAIRATKEGGELAVEGSTGLKPFMLTQVLDEKLLNRLGALAEQTSLVIPTRLKEQMQSAVNYITQYQKNIGAGNFKSFQNAVANFGQFISKAKSMDRADIDYTDIGENIVALDELNTILRNVQSKGMYKKIFDKLQNSSYNLDDLRELISKQYKTIIPTSDPGKATTKKTVGELLAANKGEMALRKLILDVMDLGRTSNKGTKPRELNVGQLKSAVETFNKNNPGFNIDPADVSSPAKILQEYASRFGYLAKNVFGDSAPEATKNPILAKQAMEMRNGLLELIGKPKKPVEGIDKELKAANDFYKKTFDTTTLLEQARLGAKQDAIVEPADISEMILGVPGGSTRGRASTKTLEYINKMEEYVRANIDKISGINEKDLTKLKGAFLETLRFKIGRAASTDPAQKKDVTALDVYLNSFEPRSLLALGIDKATEKKLRADAKVIAQLNDAKFLDITGVTTPEDTPFRFVYEELLKGGSTEKFKNMRNLLTVAKTAAKMGDKTQLENIRKGLLEFIISKDSGVIDTVTKKTAYAGVGTDVIDVNAFKQIMDEINGNPGFAEILTKKDIDVLNTIFDYTAIIQQAGTDAGAALSGAQLVSNVITIDPRKLVSALTRIAAQRKIAQFIASGTMAERALDYTAGKGVFMSPMEKAKALMIGPQTLGTIAARFALEGIDDTYDIRSIEEQTEEILEAPALSPGANAILNQFGIQ